MYSGIGISFQDVDNKYVSFYTIFILSFSLPFLVFGNTSTQRQKSELDFCLLKRYKVLHIIAFLYLIFLFIPLVYPEFKLFNPITIRDEYWESIDEYRSNPLISITDTFAMLIKPFFFAYLSIYLLRHPKGKKHLFLFGIVILFTFIRLHYLGRNQMSTFAVEFLLIAFCIKGLDIRIKKRYIIAVVLIALYFVPYLYAQTFYRHGESFDKGILSFMDIANMLFDSEFFYPIYYDEILKNPYFDTQTALAYFLYVICLPIPSFIWASKPSLAIADSFTYAILGVERGDVGFHIILPSVMGESLLFFGDRYFWVFAIFSGFVVAMITRYLCRHKTMTLYLFYLIIQAFTYGRGGTAALLPTLINGVLGIIIFDLFIYINKTGKKNL